jgi:hypothetical protein
VTATSPTATSRTKKLIDMTPITDPADVAARRKAARRTAIWVAVVAVTIYALFLLSGVLGK